MTLKDELEAVAILKANYGDLVLLDDELLIDSIEGETGLFEIFDRMIAGNVYDAAAVEACDKAIDAVKARQERFKKRIESRRAMIEQAMVVAGINRAERPLATLSIQTRKASVIVTSEAEIPSRFWKSSAPTLDKKALSEALSSGEEVDGATLSNKAPSLTIRTK